MPFIVSQEQLADGLRIVMSGAAASVMQITSNDLTAQVKSGTIANCETVVNNLLTTRLAGRNFSALVKVLSIVPLQVLLATGPVGMSVFPTHG